MRQHNIHRYIHRMAEDGYIPLPSQQWRRGLVTLNHPTFNHPTFNHATVNHWPVIDCAFSNIPIKTEDGQDVHSEHDNSAIFPIQTWTHYEAGQGVLPAEQHAVEGWHFGLQTFFHCHHLTLWTFVQGIKKDLQMQHSSFLQKLLVHNLLSE